MAVAVDLTCFEPPARLRLTNSLAEHYRPRIQRHATRIARKLPRHVQVNDLVSAGFAGLVDAFRNFDPERMESFEAYIDHRIRGAILDELRAHDPLSRDRRTFVRKMALARQQLVSRLGREPSEAEVALEMDMSLALFRSRVARASEMAQHQACEGSELVEEKEDDANRSPEARVEMTAERLQVLRACETLPERQRLVLRLHYREELTLRQIGERLGVTESRVSQIHAEAILRVRCALTGRVHGRPANSTTHTGRGRGVLQADPL